MTTDTLFVINAELATLDAALAREGALDVKLLARLCPDASGELDAAIACFAAELEARRALREKLVAARDALTEARDALRQLESLPALRVELPTSVLRELERRAAGMRAALELFVVAP